MTENYDVGVIIGRFQVPDLTDGHHSLIRRVKERHKKVIILLGSTPKVLVSRRNPLDYFTRMSMIQASYPDIVILPIHDMPDDSDWSKEVDRKINEVLGENTIVLYGSRDAFIPHYNGQFPTLELEQTHSISGTEVRTAASNEVRQHSEFRRGVVYAAYNRHPVAYPTVDIAIIYHKDSIILGRKRNDPPGMWRFPGGFVDPTRDESIDIAARREAREEVKCEISTLKYIGSTRIDDWRYRNEVDKIITSVFLGTYSYGPIEAGDDLHEVKIFPLKDFKLQTLLPEHRKIMEIVLNHLNKDEQWKLSMQYPDGCPKCGGEDHYNLGDGACLRM